MNINSCQICNSDSVEPWNEVYQACRNCGHHIALHLHPQTIINEALKLENMTRVDSLDRFKTQMIEKFTVQFNHLIDIGCGSGKFIFQNQKLFKRSVGVEVSPECVEFARNTLKLEIEPHYPKDLNPDVITMWHSLEHIPMAAIEKLFAEIHRSAPASLRLFISVPNAASWLHKVLRENDPYYDSTSHFHEFSFDSLSYLLKKFNFEVQTFSFSWPYAVFGWAQGLSNIFHPIRNYFYYRFRRGSGVPQSLHYDALAIVLMVSLTPVALGLAALESLAPRQAGVINLVAKKF